MTDLYDVAGIDDVAGFYRERFFTGGVLEAGFFDRLNRFDIQFARTMWVYDNVRRGSSVLDLGCGEGMLALLKRKGITLTGVDLSPQLLAAAGRNGYDATYVASLTALPFPDSSFDYVASLDVMGHVAFEDKDRVLAEIKRVLRPDGVTLHGIECLDRELHQDYDQMTEDQLRHFVNIDGHIGLEDDDEHAARFRSFFPHVQTEPRYTLCLSSAEFLKQADEYGVPFETDFLDYLRGLSFTERRAFDMAMGYVFGKISDLGIKLPKSGLYMFLKASAAPLGPFNNEHRDRSDLFRATAQPISSQSICLDRCADFNHGWFAANHLPPIARWMGERSHLRFEAASLSKLGLDLITHIPDLGSDPIELDFFLNGQRLSAISLFGYGWLRLEIEVPVEIRLPFTTGNKAYEFEIRASRTWQPCAVDQKSGDDRHLSIAVCNIQAYP
ncbi:MAG TPA: class I SAM-dependent methyltransferase [Pyrinomonadaceae bacterium]|nr:class I SAM-dependent methyltransferase [Pyrinomonadaceae bacterium]